MSVSAFDPWILAVHLRRLLARRPVRRALLMALAVVTALTATSLVRSVDAARSRWGQTRRVVVAEHDLHPGDVVEPGSVGHRDLPALAVADAALDDVPVGAVVRHPVAAGEPLVSDRLAPHGLSGPAALIPRGHRAVAVPRGPLGTPPLRVGDLVDVLAAAGGDLHGHEEESPAPTDLPYPVVEDALVIDVADEAITVAVPTADAPLVAAAVTTGLVILTLTGA